MKDWQHKAIGALLVLVLFAVAATAVQQTRPWSSDYQEAAGDLNEAGIRLGHLRDQAAGFGTRAEALPTPSSDAGVAQAYEALGRELVAFEQELGATTQSAIHAAQDLALLAGQRRGDLIDHAGILADVNVAIQAVIGAHQQTAAATTSLSAAMDDLAEAAAAATAPEAPQEARDQFSVVLVQARSIVIRAAGQAGTASAALGDHPAALMDANSALEADVEDLDGIVADLFTDHVIALEVLGILLTAAMIGALVIARPLGAPLDSTHYPKVTDAAFHESQQAADPGLATQGGGAPLAATAFASEDEEQGQELPTADAEEEE